jgi:hypothetical protein
MKIKLSDDFGVTIMKKKLRDIKDLDEVFDVFKKKMG